MPTFLFMDDDEDRHDLFRKFTADISDLKRFHSYTVLHTIHFLKAIKFDCVFLDHDLELAGFEECGIDVAEYIRLHLDPAKYPTRVVIHSTNEEGAENMRQKISEVVSNVDVIPFSKHGRNW